MPEDILTIKEVADYLKLTERTLYRLAQEGKIPAFKVGGSWRFRRDDLDHWIRQQTRNQEDEESAS
jgi:excisionase family DNA binding protein